MSSYIEPLIVILQWKKYPEMCRRKLGHVSAMHGYFPGGARQVTA